MKRKMILIIAFIFCFCCLFLAGSFNPSDSVLADLAENKAQGIKLPIIMYHHVYNKNPGKYIIPSSLFEEDLLYIKEKGYTPIVVQDLINFKNNGTPLPEKPIMITLDDGCRNNYFNAFPVLKKHNVKCVISVIGYHTDANYKDGELRLTYSHMTYEQIKEMHDSGLVEVQNHTYNMHNIKRRDGIKQKRGETDEDYEKALSEDLNKWQTKLKEKGIKCTAITYPFGSYNKKAIEAVRKLGVFEAGFTCNEKLNYLTPETDYLMLNRYNRPYGISTEEFFSKFE